jgi:hypothetical protein
MTFRHVVMWRVEADDVEGRRRLSEEIAAALAPLLAQVPTLRRMQIGINEIRPEENADIVVTMDFDDRAGFEVYRDHPDHLAAGAVIRPRYRSRLAVDFAFDD